VRMKETLDQEGNLYYQRCECGPGFTCDYHTAREWEDSHAEASDLARSILDHPSNTATATPQSRVYEHDSGDQVLVTTYADGSTTVALRLKGWTSWGAPLKRVNP
jgi:hypothetical protein